MLNFDGSNHVLVPSSALLNNLSTQMTLMCRLKYTGDAYYIFGKGQDRFYFIDYMGLAGLQILFYVTTSDGAAWIQFVGFNTLRDGNWHHVVGTYNSEGGVNNQKTYIDGIFDNQGTKTGTITTDAFPLAMASWCSGAEAVACNLFDCRLYNIELSDSEILSIANSYGSDNFVDGLLGRWLLNDKPNSTISDGLANEVRDISGNENHGQCYDGGIVLPTFYDAPLKLHARRN